MFPSRFGMFRARFGTFRIFQSFSLEKRFRIGKGWVLLGKGTQDECGKHFWFHSVKQFFDLGERLRGEGAEVENYHFCSGCKGCVIL